jgi:hypothetical protein
VPALQDRDPGYIELQKKYAADGLVVVGVSVDTDGPRPVKKFVKDFGINYRIVMADDDIQDAYGPHPRISDDLHHRPRRGDPGQETRQDARGRTLRRRSWRSSGPGALKRARGWR